MMRVHVVIQNTKVSYTFAHYWQPQRLTLAVALLPCCPAAAGVLAATGILTGVYYATPKETKDKIRRRVKKTTEE